VQNFVEFMSEYTCMRMPVFYSVNENIVMTVWEDMMKIVQKKVYIGCQKICI